jgi:hypothetical protein
MLYETERENSGIKVDVLFTNRNINFISFVETEIIRVFFTLQSAKKNSNQRCECTNIYK